MKADDMVPGRLYRYKNEVINLHFFSDDGKYAIVSTPGDLDMQSMSGISLDSEVTEVSRTSNDWKCPACGGNIEPARNPGNPEVSKWSHRCVHEDCGWLGNVDIVGPSPCLIMIRSEVAPDPSWPDKLIATIASAAPDAIVEVVKVGGTRRPARG